jgi:hypothetical protein
VRAATARALGQLGAPRAVAPLLDALDDAHPRVLEAVATALGALGDPSAIAPLVDRLAAVLETDLRVADVVIQALRAITGKDFGPYPEGWRDWWNAVRDRPWVRPDTENDPGGLTVVGGRYYGFPVRSSKVVFVLDVSRSMGWNERLDTAKDELVRVFESMPPSTRFDLVVYSDRAEPWRSQAGLREASPANVRKAIRFVRALRPDNGTNTHDALAQAFADEDADTIFFLSDGHPSVGAVVDPESILQEVRAWNVFRRVRIHAIALVRGDPPPAFMGREDPNRATVFMRRLAEENDGRFRVIR